MASTDASATGARRLPFAVAEAGSDDFDPPACGSVAFGLGALTTFRGREGPATGALTSSLSGTTCASTVGGKRAGSAMRTRFASGISGELAGALAACCVACTSVEASTFP